MLDIYIPRAKNHSRVPRKCDRGHREGFLTAARERGRVLLLMYHVPRQSVAEFGFPK